MIYLDYAAATPLDDSVRQAMDPFWQDQFYNPSASYLAGRRVAQELLAARTKIAIALGARPSEIVFTAGGTEADNLAINGIMDSFPGAKLLVGSTEHKAVLDAAQQYDHALVPVDHDGRIRTDKLTQLMDSKTVLVSVMYANNETGTIQPLKRIAQIVQAERQRRSQQGETLPLYFHTDASQATNYLDLHVSRLGVDMMTINGGKIYGPKQSGALYVKAGIELRPLVRGGGQERGLRSGTENVAGCIGLATAVVLAQDSRLVESERLQGLRDYFEESLKTLSPQITINGGKHRLPNNSHITFPGLDNERLMMELDEQGIVCAVGSACAASDDEPSHALQAMGLTKNEAQSSLRFTMGRTTTKKDLAKVLKALEKSGVKSFSE
ncbi:MAG: Cysteine desulfurase [Patescibacteria group bacterium]|nr:Cysteine desulfurase [Patescibacteria group bacterium]